MPSGSRRLSNRAPECAAGADPHDAGVADGMSGDSGELHGELSTGNRSCCSGFTRAQALRAARRGPRRRTPASRANGIRGCRSQPGRRSTAASSSPGWAEACCRSMVPVGSDSRTGCSGTGSRGRRRSMRSSSPILVSVFLQGGIDNLSLLAPAGDPLYEKLRPTLALAPGAGPAFTEDARLTWHPSATAFADLHAAGKVTVLPGIGYADPDLSHFTSRHYWEVGATDAGLQTGWLGRYLDVAGTADNPLQGLSMDGAMNPTIASARNPVAAIDRPDDFSVWFRGVWGPMVGRRARVGRQRSAPSRRMRVTGRSPRSHGRHPRSASSTGRSRPTRTSSADPRTRARSAIRPRARPISRSGSPGSPR